MPPSWHLQGRICHTNKFTSGLDYQTHPGILMDMVIFIMKSRERLCVYVLGLGWSGVGWGVGVVVAMVSWYWGYTGLVKFMVRGNNITLWFHKDSLKGNGMHSRMFQRHVSLFPNIYIYIKNLTRRPQCRGAQTSHLCVDIQQITLYKIIYRIELHISVIYAYGRGLQCTQPQCIPNK